MIPTDRFPFLERNEGTTAWLAALEGAGPPAMHLDWPDEATLVERLRYVEVPEDDIAIVRGLYPTVTADPDLRWVVERYAQLVRQHAESPGYRPLPQLPDGFGDTGRHLFTFVHLALLPETLALHAAHEVPAGISQATMADIGRHYVIEHAERHRSGLAGGGAWLTFHSRALIYQLGRLQFEVATLDEPISEAIRAAGVPCEQGEPVLAVHIPGFMGPMTPEACDASFAMARDFVARHYPERSYRFATCDSWLLDEQLADYLPESSNIIRFQRRFRSCYGLTEPNNNATLGFVFRSPGAALDDLPQRTTLERGVVQHIRAGKSWHGGVGWLELR